MITAECNQVWVWKASSNKYPGPYDIYYLTLEFMAPKLWVTPYWRCLCLDDGTEKYVVSLATDSESPNWQRIA
jgi:hypothetical protein